MSYSALCHKHFEICVQNAKLCMKSQQEKESSMHSNSLCRRRNCSLYNFAFFFFLIYLYVCSGLYFNIRKMKKKNNFFRLKKKKNKRRKKARKRHLVNCGRFMVKLNRVLLYNFAWVFCVHFFFNIFSFCFVLFCLFAMSCGCSDSIFSCAAI